MAPAGGTGPQVSQHHSGSSHEPGPDSGAGSDRSPHAGHEDGDVKPNSASSTNETNSGGLTGQHRFSEVNGTDVDPLRHVVQETFFFEMKRTWEGPTLADARVVLRNVHLDDLHHRNALAHAEGVDPKELAVKTGSTP